MTISVKYFLLTSTTDKLPLASTVHPPFTIYNKLHNTCPTCLRQEMEIVKYQNRDFEQFNDKTNLQCENFSVINTCNRLKYEV